VDLRVVVDVREVPPLLRREWLRDVLTMLGVIQEFFGTGAAGRLSVQLPGPFPLLHIPNRGAVRRPQGKITNGSVVRGQTIRRLSGKVIQPHVGGSCVGIIAEHGNGLSVWRYAWPVHQTWWPHRAQWSSGAIEPCELYASCRSSSAVHQNAVAGDRER
jgi:hypothetical protein